MRESIGRLAGIGFLAGATLAGATTRLVTKTADTNDGVCNADCSLREAIAVAGSGDDVDVPAGTYTLGSVLSVGQTLTIHGSSTIDAILKGGSGIRVFVVTAAGNLTLQHLTVRDSTITSSSDRDGGCIKVSGDLVLEDVVFTNCKAWNGGTSLANLQRGGEGGAIFVASGATLVVTTSAFTSNVAGKGETGSDGISAGPGGRGGAVATAGATTIASSTFSSNSAGLGGQPNGNGGTGGAIGVLPGGSLRLESSTIAQNHSGDGNEFMTLKGADGAGGGVSVEADAALANVTFSGNTIGSTASGGLAVGGAIVVVNGTTRLRNVTIAQNTSSGAGGGVARTGGTLILRNSIVANNTSSGTTSENCTTTLAGSFQSEGFNLLNISTGCATSLVGTDQVAAAGLGAFGSYGGGTNTYPLTISSPALDGGDPLGCEAWDPVGATDVPLATDQRGVARPIDGDGDLTATCDAGSYEAPEPPKNTFTVTIDPGSSGTGSVASDPTGIDCPGDCEEDYFPAQSVELTALADSGSAFAGWSGDCAGTGTCTLGMTVDRNATASFALLRSLSLSFAGDGSGTVTSDPAGIDCTANCGADFLDGEAVTLTAIPDGNSLFVEWSGDCSGPTCELTMDAGRSATATFFLKLIFASDFANDFAGWSNTVLSGPDSGRIRASAGFGKPD